MLSGKRSWLNNTIGLEKLFELRGPSAYTSLPKWMSLETIRLIQILRCLHKENPRSCQGQNGSKYRGLTQLPKNDQINIFSISSLNAHHSVRVGICFCRIWLSTQSVALYSPIRLRQRYVCYYYLILFWYLVEELKAWRRQWNQG